MDQETKDKSMSRMRTLGYGTSAIETVLGQGTCKAKKGKNEKKSPVTLAEEAVMRTLHGQGFGVHKIKNFSQGLQTQCPRRFSRNT